MKRALVVGFLVALGGVPSTPAMAATMSYADYERVKDEPVAKAYFQGLAQGVISTNNAAIIMAKPLFCQPADLNLSFIQIKAILDNLVKPLGDDIKSQPLDVLLITSLRAAFPCPK